MLHFVILWFMATVVPDQSKWSTIFCITTQLSTARSIYLETWIWLYFKRSFNTHYLPLYRKLKTPLLVIMVQNWSWAHHWPIFSRKVLSALSVHRNCNNGSFLSHFYNHWISVSMSREIKSMELSCSFRPLPKYYEKIPRTCLIAEVRHEMGSPFRYRYLPPTNRHIMQLYICEHDSGIQNYEVG